MLLNQKRLEASAYIGSQIRNHHKHINRDLLELWANYETYRMILLMAHSFGKFAIKDGQLSELDKAIRRVKYTIFGPVSTIRIGSRI
jgi:hypothetical protein